jgi:hypothetical protein
MNLVYLFVEYGVNVHKDNQKPILQIIHLVIHEIFNIDNTQSFYES